MLFAISFVQYQHVWKGFGAVDVGNFWGAMWQLPPEQHHELGT